MAKFIFKLEPALRTRIAAEKQAMASLAQVERERQEMQSRLQNMQKMIEDLRLSQRLALGLGEPGQVVHVRGAGQEAASIAKLQLRAQQYTLQLAGVYARVDRAREALRLAAVARKSVELLREARLEEWRREQDRVESAALDDISQSRGLAHAKEQDDGAIPDDEQPGAESERAA